jgi:hypothetical protein
MRADRTHAISELEAEAHTKSVKISFESDTLYKRAISSNEECVLKTGFEISRKESLLREFSRNYKLELDTLFESRDRLYAEKEKMYEKKGTIGLEIQEEVKRKRAAHASLESAKADVESWYAKSGRTPWLFGNGGKRLPQHAMFGQSFGDLDSFKADRDAALRSVKSFGDSISSLKSRQNHISEEIAKVQHSLGKLREDIHQVKTDRSQMFDLKNTGVNAHQLSNELLELRQILSAEEVALRNLENAKYEFIETARHQSGLVDLETKILQLKNKKSQFLKEFDLEESKARRVQEHRQTWLQGRGLS